MCRILKNRITYRSTNCKAPEVSFREALLKGIAPDGGLYVPGKIPVLSQEELESFRKKEYNEIAVDILKKYVDDEIGDIELRKICTEAYNFEIPLEKVTEGKYILRLDRGPTFSFKDFAARMMSRMMQHFLAGENGKLTILTATSGDTGSAVASAFFGLKNINVIILFPKDEVSLMQRKQMTTLGENISIIAVDGKFDDCQSLVKRAFLDTSLSHIPFSSANSINIGRLLPQSVYYCYAWSRSTVKFSDKIIFSVPSGNFGNLTAGILAKRMGLPVKRFIVATNSNDEVPVFLNSSKYEPVVPSRNCISSAMNVGHPSNLARIISFYNGNIDDKGLIIRQPDMKQLQNDLYGVAVTDETTRKTILDTWESYNVLLEPHGAVAWRGVCDYIAENSSNDIIISLETAHPAKFPAEIQKILNFTPTLPAGMSEIESKNESYDTIPADYNELKKLIIRKN